MADPRPIDRDDAARFELLRAIASRVTLTELQRLGENRWLTPKDVRRLVDLKTMTAEETRAFKFDPRCSTTPRTVDTSLMPMRFASSVMPPTAEERRLEELRTDLDALGVYVGPVSRLARAIERSSRRLLTAIRIGLRAASSSWADSRPNAWTSHRGLQQLRARSSEKAW